MSHPEENRVDDAGADGTPVDDLVRHQQRIIGHWSRYLRGCADRVQSGSFDPSVWLDAYTRFVRETADDVAGAVRALARF